MPDPLSDLQRLGQEFDADVVEAVARAIGDAVNADKEVFLTGRGVYEFEGEPYIDVDGALALYPLARAAIEAARPMIEAEALERAAGVADELERLENERAYDKRQVGSDDNFNRAKARAATHIAAAIRSLIEPQS